MMFIELFIGLFIYIYIYILTALVSVATADVMNIIENVTTISITRAWRSLPDGDVVPTRVIGCNKTRRVNPDAVAPVSCAAA